MQDRAAREKHAYDESDVWEVSNAWHMRFGHVFLCPNTVKAQEKFHSLAKGKRVLDVGCGFGELSRVLKETADYVLGVDISEKEIARAKQHERPGLEFRATNVEEAEFSDQFDVICGQSILHHIEYKPLIEKLRSKNLLPGGVLVFDEPMGGNFLILTFTKLVRKAHTPDERSFMKEDIEWFRSIGAEIIPFNYFSLMFGLVSSKLSKNPNNWLMRQADKMDQKLVDKVPAHKFRRALIVLRR